MVSDKDTLPIVLHGKAGCTHLNYHTVLISLFVDQIGWNLEGYFVSLCIC